MGDEPILPAILAASAFAGAAGAQLVAHTLTERREERRYVREAYQNLFAPVLLDIFRYLDNVTDIQERQASGAEQSRRQSFTRIATQIEHNLMYAGPRIISAIHEVRRHQTWDETGFELDVGRMRLLADTLDELHELTRRSRIFMPKLARQLSQYRVLCILLLIATRLLRSPIKAEMLLCHKWVFDYARMTSATRAYFQRFLPSDPRELKYNYNDFIEAIARKLIVNPTFQADFKQHANQILYSSVSEAQYAAYYGFETPPVPAPASDPGSLLESLLSGQYETPPARPAAPARSRLARDAKSGMPLKIHADAQGSFRVNGSLIEDIVPESDMFELICADGEHYYLTPADFRRFFKG